MTSLNNDKDKAKVSLYKTIKKMVPAIFTAMVATVLGFIALSTSPVPMIQDFGNMLTVGMVISFLLALFFLLPILFARDHFFTPKTKNKTNKPKKPKRMVVIDRFLEWFTQKTIVFRWGIIIIAFAAAAFGISVDLDADVETDVETFMPQDSQELADIHKLRDILGTTDQVSLVYRGDDVLTDESLEWVGKMTESLPEEFPDVVVETKSITGILKRMNDHGLPSGREARDQIADMPEGQTKLFINEDHSKGVITVGIKHLEASDLEKFLGDLELYLNDHDIASLDTTITGKSVLDVEMIDGLAGGRYQMTLLGAAFVFLGLLLLYRHPVKAFIPLLPILLIVGWSGAIMYFLGINYTPLTATLGALIIGIGTEFTILIMERYFEEREKGHPKENAMQITNKTIGKAIFATALANIGGFSALVASDFVILSDFGLMTLINISLALFSTIVVLPTILIVLDRYVKMKQTT
ncbi:RND family transporter [Siminovitchia sediminis]|uniref:RND family transporter n=1 Tax=Siminovitchia sediminis TaxID=1274353 RepID=A0ABW4KHJ1_9BACI|nr:MMPL family protein [Bacillus freudenreichii]